MPRSFWSRCWNCPLFSLLARGLAVSLPVESVGEDSGDVDVGVDTVRLVGYKPEREFNSFLV